MESPNRESPRTQDSEVDKVSKELKKDLATTREQRDALAHELARTLEGDRAKLKNPSWKELKSFLLADSTDTLPYIAGEFDCNGFALRIRDNAQLRGYRSAYVFASFQDKHVGHALNRFQLDTGELVYVDATSSDTIAYVAVGKPYVRIPLKAVKPNFARCTDSSCRSLVVQDFSQSIFGMEYAALYQERVREYLASLEELNNDKRAYNAKPAYIRTTREYDSLRARDDNLDRVFAHLGGEIHKSEEWVSSTKEFWN